MDPHFIEFYQGWTNKLHAIQGEETPHIFDRFITAFVIYNFLYNQIPLWMIRNGRPVTNKLNDNKSATDRVVTFLTATHLLKALEVNNSEIDIQNIVNLISTESFYINLNYGERQRNEDLKLLVDLQSNDSNKKAVSILKVIYYVRCNLFHGHKSFHDYQTSLLRPLINILNLLNPILFNKLIS